MGEWGRHWERSVGGFHRSWSRFASSLYRVLSASPPSVPLFSSGGEAFAGLNPRSGRRIANPAADSKAPNNLVRGGRRMLAGKGLRALKHWCGPQHAVVDALML